MTGQLHDLNEAGGREPLARSSPVSRSVLVLSHLYPSSAYPGLGPFVRDEVVEHAKRHSVTVVSPVLWRLGGLLDERKRVAEVPEITAEDGVRIWHPRLVQMPPGARFAEPWLWAVRLRPCLRRVWEEMGGELIHAHYALPDGFAAADYASHKDVPLVLTLWGSDVLEPGLEFIAGRYLRRTFSRAQAIIAVSDELASRAEQFGAEPGRIRVIPGGVPYLPREPRDAARDEAGIPTGTICVLWVGGLVPVKQPLDMLKAFVEFSAGGHADASLAMIGDGPLRKTVEAFIREHDLGHKVLVLGHRTRHEVWKWQCAADVLVNSSFSEGTPLSVLEALGAGTPVAGYPLRGVQAAVNAVQGGSIAKTRSPAALAAAIVSALGGERDRDALSSDARELFAIARAARETEEVYATVA